MKKISFGYCAILLVAIGGYWVVNQDDLQSNKIELTMPSKYVETTSSSTNAKVSASLLKAKNIANQIQSPKQNVKKTNGPLLSKSLMEQYLDEELWLEIIPEDDELYEYLLALWDGQSAKIPDAIYDIEIDKIGNLQHTILVAHKDRITENSSADFAINVQEMSMLELNRDEELGEYSIEKERDILNLANGLEDNDHQLIFKSLRCRESKCSMYIQATNFTHFEKFTDGLSNMQNASIQILKSDNNLSEAQIFVIYTE